MKRSTPLLTLTAIMLISSPNLASADSVTNSEQTNGGSPVVTGGYGGPATRVSLQAEGPRVYVGGRGGLLLWNKLLLGAGGYVGVPDEEEEDRTAGYGGISVELLLPSPEAVSLSVDALLGAGGADYTTADEQSSPEAFLVAEAGMSLNIHATSFMTISPNLRYLHTLSISGEERRARELSGLSAGIQLRFGMFRSDPGNPGRRRP